MDLVNPALVEKPHIRQHRLSLNPNSLIDDQIGSRFIISGIIGIVAIAIVFWDHFIDDILLRIQLFYENIENLIFSYYKSHILVERIEREPQEETKKERLHLLYTHRIDNNYYSNVIIQNFDECAKYLGLTCSEESRFYVNFYINLLPVYKYHVSKNHLKS